MSVSELESVVKKAKNLIKDKKDGLKQKNKELLLEVPEGKRIKVIFKGEPTIARFVKVTESRFTVDISGSNKSILFDKLVTLEP